jgi:hypothetical protein
MTFVPAASINFGGGAKDGGVGAAVRDFVALDGRYILGVGPVEIEIDRLRRKWDELIGQLTVRCSLAGARTIAPDNTISAADFAVSNLRARQERASLLMKRSQAPTIDWFGLLEEFCARVLTAERTGQPAVHLRDLARPAADADFEIDGLRLLAQHPVIWFGDGGAGKSLLALYCAGQLARRGLRVGYFDWEFSGDEHRDRLERLFGPDMPDLIYARCDRPLVAEVDRLRRIVQDERLDYNIFDSVAFATDGPPEAAENAAAYFRAVRSLGVGSLHIAHTTKGEGGEQKPFGSVFWHNGARGTWYAQRADESPDGRQIMIGLFNRKANTGPLRAAVGFELSFDADRTCIRRTDLAGSQDLAGTLPMWQRMREVLRGGAMTMAALAEELDTKPDTIKKAAKRGDGRLFTRVVGTDGVARIGLVDRRTG